MLNCRLKKKKSPIPIQLRVTCLGVSPALPAAAMETPGRTQNSLEWAHACPKEHQGTESKGTGTLENDNSRRSADAKRASDSDDPGWPFARLCVRGNGRVTLVERTKVKTRTPEVRKHEHVWLRGALGQAVPFCASVCARVKRGRWHRLRRRELGRLEGIVRAACVCGARHLRERGKRPPNPHRRPRVCPSPPPLPAPVSARGIPARQPGLRRPAGAGCGAGRRGVAEAPHWRSPNGTDWNRPGEAPFPTATGPGTLGAKSRSVDGRRDPEKKLIFKNGSFEPSFRLVGKKDPVSGNLTRI